MVTAAVNGPMVRTVGSNVYFLSKTRAALDRKLVTRFYLFICLSACLSTYILFFRALVLKPRRKSDLLRISLDFTGGCGRSSLVSVTLLYFAVKSEVIAFSYHTSFALWESMPEPGCTD